MIIGEQSAAKAVAYRSANQTSRSGSHQKKRRTFAVTLRRTLAEGPQGRGKAFREGSAPKETALYVLTVLQHPHPSILTEADIMRPCRKQLACRRPPTFLKITE